MFHEFCIEVKVKQTAPETSVFLTFLQDIEGPHDSMVKRGPILAAFSIINEKIIRVQSVKINLQCELREEIACLYLSFLTVFALIHIPSRKRISFSFSFHEP